MRGPLVTTATHQAGSGAENSRNKMDKRAGRVDKALHVLHARSMSEPNDVILLM
jgi:hypothetical protein